MARSTLVLDASVGVKWFSSRDESHLQKALEIRDAHLDRKIQIIVPDLFYYEITNAIVHKSFFSDKQVKQAAGVLYDLGLNTVAVGSERLTKSVEIARRNKITVYDACYMAFAQEYECPLVTANPRHQKNNLDCEVVYIDQWKLDL